MNQQQIKEIGLVGTGLIGASWAGFYASKGFTVRMYDADEGSCRKGYDKAVDCLEFLADNGMLPQGDVKEAIARVSMAESLAECVGQADLIQESAAERYDVKKELFGQIDGLARSEALIASSSSGLSMSEIQKVMRHPERALIAHPFNPPHLIPLVELVGGDQTDERIVARVKVFFEGLGKVPVVLKKEVPGYLANRLQAAVWREAMDLVRQGAASVEDVDKALCCGPGLRWALMGANTVFHLGGGEGGIEYFIDHITAVPLLRHDIFVKGSISLSWSENWPAST